ncbi:hypothetical protein FYK55_13885 [Roseiconus nitratireducens]|uniref:Transmembrane protein n=1 Tax=Roseiconus nitratireducens TaxID=2605748 RepID=A0A5M6D552_9BACT|nr:hypothetical protein [Roseiconus nitratireducens]KAA5542621.1 hypothetical protein FYK55_13885 [Roseiconus nitratireducens]
MTDADDEFVPEKPDRLWSLTFPPLVWAVHFLASYLTAAIWCAKAGPQAGDADPVRVAIAAYTVVALTLIAVFGWIAFRKHRTGEATLPHDFDSRADQHRFLGFATTLLAILSFVATVFTALVVVFVGSCH